MKILNRIKANRRRKQFLAYKFNQLTDVNLLAKMIQGDQ